MPIVNHVVLAAHQSKQVQDLAQRLATEVSNATLQTSLLVFNVIQRRDSAEQMDLARLEHEAAMPTTAALRVAVQTAGSGHRGRR